MLAKFRSWCVSVYVHLTGVRFYSTDTLPVNTDIQKFIVKTLHGYSITFTFYKEKLKFSSYSFKKLKFSLSTIYVVKAEFDSSAPPIMLNYNSVRIFVGRHFVYLFTEEIIIQTLLNVYLDYLLNEMDIERRKVVESSVSTETIN